MKHVEVLVVVQVEEWRDAGYIEDNSAVVQLWGRAVAYFETVEVQAGLAKMYTGQVDVSVGLQADLAETLSVVPVELVGALAGHADLHAGQAEKVNIFTGQVGCGEPTELQAAVETLVLVQLG